MKVPDNVPELLKPAESVEVDQVPNVRREVFAEVAEAEE